MPGNGIVADPGLAAVIPGSGVIMMWPVSVCHQVSTTGQRPPPITFQYHAHALGLIGSPNPCRQPLPRGERVADAAEQSDRREGVLLGVLGAPLHRGADGGGRGVEDRHAVALADLP